MSLDQNVAMVEEGRVVRLFGERTVELQLRERLREERSPPYDAGSPPRDERQWRAIQLRLDEDLERAVREPLSTIATVAAVLRHQVSEAQGEQLRSVATAALRADAAIQDLLCFLRTAAGGLRLNRRHVDLKLLCERVVDAVSIANPDRPMVLTSDRRVDGSWDPEAVEMVLSKLLGNAIEHGGVRPAIRIGVRGLADHAIVEVWSSGGITDESVRDHLFDPFVSSRRPSPEGARGLGLGLHLARQLARAHGGEVELQSEDRDGTAFRVTLPRS